MLFLRFLNLLTNKFGMELTPCIGLLMISLGCLFIYPVKPIPQNIFFILVGLCLIGGAGAPINVPSLINMSSCLKIYDKNLDEFTANDIASTLYTIANNIGDFIGPTLGGFLSTKIGFKYCCVFLSFFFFGYLLIYFWFFYKGKNIEEKTNLNNLNITKDEYSFSVQSNDNLNKTFLGNVNGLFQEHTSFIKRRFTFGKKKQNKLLNHTLISSLTC
jgi:MFS family permease